MTIETRHRPCPSDRPPPERIAGEALAIVLAMRAALVPPGAASRLDVAGRLDELHGLLASLVATPAPDATDLPYAGLAPWQLRAVERRIEHSLGDRLRLEDMAAEARLSARHFGRAFKRATGHSPHAYLTRRRLEHACRLMIETDAGLAHIADACGLSDQAHLARLFRQHFQQTPRRWRWENRGPAPRAPAPQDAAPRDLWN